MKKLLLAGAAIVGMLAMAPVAQAQTTWIAAAANSLGSGYAEAGNEDEAKQMAIDDCENNTGSTCAWTRKTAVSVPSGWYLVVARCSGGRYAVAASQWDWDTALQGAANKANGHRCRATEQY